GERGRGNRLGRDHLRRPRRLRRGRDGHHPGGTAGRGRPAEDSYSPAAGGGLEWASPLAGCPAPEGEGAAVAGAAGAGAGVAFSALRSWTTLFTYARVSGWRR